MANKKAKTFTLKPDTLSETQIAGMAGAESGKSREKRDAMTRAKGAIKVTDTKARQWNRYSV